MHKISNIIINLNNSLFLQNGNWAKEQNSKSPIKVNAPFKLTMHVFEKRIVYKINDTTIGELEIDKPLNEIHALQIAGDVTVQSMDIGYLYPITPFSSILPSGLWKKGNFSWFKSQTNAMF